MIISISLILIGIYGIIRNRKNVILILICIELISLGIITLVIFATQGFDDQTTDTYCIVVLVIAGIESAIGLSIIVWYFRENKSLEIYRLR